MHCHHHERGEAAVLTARHLARWNGAEVYHYWRLGGKTCVLFSSSPSRSRALSPCELVSNDKAEALCTWAAWLQRQSVLYTHKGDHSKLPFNKSLAICSRRRGRSIPPIRRMRCKSQFWLLQILNLFLRIKKGNLHSGTNSETRALLTSESTPAYKVTCEISFSFYINLYKCSPHSGFTSWGS